MQRGLSATPGIRVVEENEAFSIPAACRYGKRQEPILS